MLLLDINRKNGKLDTIHFTGIGGIGMSGMAEIMHNLGYKIQGSDISENSNTKRLQDKGIKVFNKQVPDNLKNVSYIIISSAIKDDNLEVIFAKKLKIPIITRAEMLAELMRLKCSIAISGSHGKTTTTSLVACLFEAANLDPTVINGGIINNCGTNAYLGSGDYLIAEADESDATFIKIPSTIAVITNIDPEHMDYYKDFETLIKAFEIFITNLPFYGFGVLCLDHPVVREIADNVTKRRIISYGIEREDVNIFGFNIKSDSYISSFDVKIKFSHDNSIKIIKDITIPTPGKHNVLNALAAIAIGVELNFGIDVIKNGFQNFQGVKRRFSKVLEYNGAEIIDDYAHHPVEIEATLLTACDIAKKRNGKIYAIFQPHRYSRLENLFSEFVSSFNKADHVFIMDVFSAGENPIKGIDSKSLVSSILESGKKASFIESKDNFVNIIKSHANNNDLFVFMGAGSISKWVNELPEKLS